jgi:hypothetical protein
LKEKVRSETSEDVSNEFSIFFYFPFFIFFVLKEADSFVGQSFVSKIVLSSGQTKLQQQSKTKQK